MIGKNAAVIGLGIIGSRACARLADAGWEIKCWNRTPKGLPGEVATAVEAVAGAKLISIYLKDAPAVREVVGAIAAGLKPGQVLLNHATLDLETTRWLEKTCEAQGSQFLDVPFTGSKDASAKGQLFYYIGGDAALAASLQPYLMITAKGSLYCGDVGSATVMKLATNLVSACTVQALAEALAIVTRNGVAAERFMEAVANNASGSVLSGMKLPKMVAGDYETHFSLSNMGKDSRYMLALADAAGLETPAIAAVSKRMGELEADGLGNLDFSAVAKPYLEKA